MTNRHKAFLLWAFLSILTANLWAQNDTSSRPEYLYEKEHPLRETRAVWLTTIGGLDWPRIWATDASSRERQKEELVRILDNYQRANINTVIFQTRVRAALLYPSKIEPWEMSLTGIPGQSPGYDPLAFCIDECHKRGMELHAWVVCIPIGTKQRQNGYGAASLIRKHPELVKTVKGGEMFMIPGKPETADYIASICQEIVENYDVDGISLDYIRYPESTFNYSDDELYPRASNLSKATPNPRSTTPTTSSIPAPPTSRRLSGGARTSPASSDAFTTWSSPSSPGSSSAAHPSGNMPTPVATALADGTATTPSGKTPSAGSARTSRTCSSP